MSEEWEVSPPEIPVQRKTKTKINTNTMSEEWVVSSPQRSVEGLSCVCIKNVRARFV